MPCGLKIESRERDMDFCCAPGQEFQNFLGHTREKNFLRHFAWLRKLRK